jgi:hypothetical protein
MATELRYPSINARTDKEQLAQMKAYLYQLVDQLQFALNNVGSSSLTVVQSTASASKAPQQNPVGNVDAQATFNKIKSLIIKSADIVDAYYQAISTKLAGTYVAESVFGTFVENTEQQINQSSTDIEQLFSNMQAIQTDIENLNFTLADVNAYIKSGLLDYDENGIPVYGLEIGQQNTVDGEKVFSKFARFASDRLSFYDQNDQEVAYVSDYKLYIRNVEITTSSKIGGYKDIVMPNGSIITKWVGIGGDG